MRTIGMRTAGISLAAMALALAAGSAAADDKLQYAPAADWVRPVDIPKPDPALNDAPIQFLLENSQIHFAADGDSTYNEYAVRIQTTQGMQAAQSYVNWNPDTDVVTINKAVIIRGDQTIDLLKNGQTYTVLRRESNMERSMLDGILTGVLQPEGLQVGDILDYGMTVRRHDPVYHDNSESVTAVSAPVKIGKIVIRASWDASKPIRFHQSDALPKATVTTTAGNSDVLLEADNYTAPTPPSEAPARFNQGGYVEFSQFASWRDISRLMAPLYDTASTLAADSPLKAETAKIRAASTDPKVQAAMALQLVESNVRYLFLGMNQGGYIPAGADTTWQRRFGDCKGKAALLLALLRDLGIKADAVAVSTVAGDGLDQHLPEIELFDHVIVRTEIAGKVYWLDATRFGDRDLDSLAVPPFVWALTLRADGADLEPLQVQPYDKPETETSIRLDASAGLNVPARAHIETTYRYDTALSSRATVEALSPADRDKYLKQYWSDQYDWIRPTKVSADYDETTGEEHFIMDGDATMQWDQDDKGGGWKYTTDLTPVGWGDGLHRDPGPHRDAPMVLNFPNYYVTREEIDLPRDGKGFTFQGTSFDKTMASTQFHRAVALKGNVFTLDSSKRSLAPEISYAEATKDSDALVKMWNDVVYLVAPLSYKSGASEPQAVADTTQPVTADDYAVRGGQRMTNNDQDAALSDFNQALRLDPTNLKALQGRGMVFIFRGKDDAALADCQQAAKIDPTAWTAFNCVGQAYMAKQQYSDAIDAFTKALAIYPNDSWALQARAGAYLATGDKDKAKADAQAALDLDPTAAWAIGTLAQMAMDDGRLDDAMAIIDKALEATPDDPMLLRQKITVLENCRGQKTQDDCLARKAGAVPIYDKLIAANPGDVESYALRAQDRLASDRDAAMADLDTAIKLDPKNAIPYLVRAAIDLRDKANDKALDDVNAALAAEPGNEQALNIRARVYFLLKRPDDAFADLDALLAKHPDDPEYLNNACWSRATHNYQLDKALEQCNASLKVKPDNAHVLDSRAFVELRLGQYDAAIADYDAALALVPTMGPSLYGRGIAKLRKGMKTEGNADLDAARKLYAGVDDEFKGYGVTP